MQSLKSTIELEVNFIVFNSKHHEQNCLFVEIWKKDQAQKLNNSKTKLMPNLKLKF